MEKSTQLIGINGGKSEMTRAKLREREFNRDSEKIKAYEKCNNCGTLEEKSQMYNRYEGFVTKYYCNMICMYAKKIVNETKGITNNQQQEERVEVLAKKYASRHCKSSAKGRRRYAPSPCKAGSFGQRVTQISPIPRFAKLA